MGRVCVLLLVFSLGCTAEQSRDQPARPELTAEERAAGLELFRAQDCNVCHGEEAEGQEAGPALRALAPYWTVDRLMSYLESPDTFREANPDFEDRRGPGYELEMPAYDFLSDDDRRTLARWLMTL